MARRGRGSGGGGRSNSEIGAHGGVDRSMRQLRVGEAVRHALSDVFLREEFRDPDLAGINVTCSEVRVSPDLKNATAFVAPLGGGTAGRQEAMLRGLKRVAPYLRSAVARQVPLRAVPQLSFQADTSFDTAARIGGLLRDPKVAADLDPPSQDVNEADNGTGASVLPPPVG